VKSQNSKMQNNVLDDAKKIEAVDKSRMMSFCVTMAKHYKEAYDLTKKIQLNYPKPEKIIVAGMGGSAIGGDLLKDWTRTKIKIPIEVNRDYQLPAYADKNTLVIITSYSGDTEESLGAFLDAKKRNCMIYAVSSGGALIEYAEKLKVPFLRVPSGMPPRTALPYLFLPLLVIVEKTGLVPNVSSEVSEALKVLEQASKTYSPNVLQKSNPAKTLASNIHGLVPIIYGFEFYRSVAQRFKQQFNENSKTVAKWDVLPELDHNEVVGWEKSEDSAKCFAAIFIRDKDEPIPIYSRIEITKQLMKKSGVKMFEVQCQGKSTLAKMFSVICIGDFASIYLAVLRGVDPAPVETINLLKSALGKNGVKEEILGSLDKLV
jgi:glucose/mannose-6-phosphate isomerase